MDTSAVEACRACQKFFDSLASLPCFEEEKSLGASLDRVARLVNLAIDEADAQDAPLGE